MSAIFRLKTNFDTEHSICLMDKCQLLQNQIQSIHVVKPCFTEAMHIVSL